jgi:myosin heavy subunit
MKTSEESKQEKEVLQKQLEQKEQELLSWRQTHEELQLQTTQVQQEKEHSDRTYTARITALEEEKGDIHQKLSLQEKSLQSLTALQEQVLALETEKKELASQLSTARSQLEQQKEKPHDEPTRNHVTETESKPPTSYEPTVQEEPTKQPISTEPDQKTPEQEITANSVPPPSNASTDTSNQLQRETSMAENETESSNANDDDKVTELNWGECGAFIKTKINAQTADKIWEKLQDEHGMIPGGKLVELMIFVGTLQVSYEYKRKNLGKPQIHKVKFKKFIVPFQQWLIQTHLTESNSLSKKQFVEQLGDWVVEYGKTAQA